MLDEKLLKPYDPKTTENKIYKLWEESGFFNPDICIKKGIVEKNADYFSMVLPPPNVTGDLHIGHALGAFIEDTMVRYNRMSGKKTLWLPGTDHAAIATQSKVEKMIYKEEGKNRYDLGREKFLKKVEKFAQKSHNNIIKQLKKMGVSLDWSREAYTLDKKRSLAVQTVFKKMYNDGLIYRGYRVVNWDPKGQTTISDDEIVYEERKAVMYTFKYSKDFPIYISTTRPETKVGDTAVAVHPNDKRYKKFVGQIFEIENFVGEKLSIKIIADESVDPELGTGALGVTPAHSQVDWEIAQRHNLPLKPVINEHARMSVESTLIKDKKTTEAREIIVNWLRVNGLLEKEEEVMQNVSTAERTGGIIEPLPKLQWFIDVNKEIPSHNNKSLKELMLETVKNGEIKIVPDRFKKVYYNWIENLRDWCISRQIWFGHRIPVWYHGEEIYCDIKAPKEKKWVQDEDTLDTWFSSGLWTFSTLGWPEITDDFKNYYPTTMLETGYDILFFWIARMILMSTYATGQIPFKNVYLHGLVRDNQGRKISKSLGNNIDPINIINEYGADALRMALIVGTGPGNDTKLDLNKVKAYKHFANKIWNVTRFVLSNAEDIKYDENFSDYTSSEKKLIKERDELINKITKEMEEYKFYLVSEKIYHYVWHTLADVILEESKKIFSEGNDEEKKSRKQFLLHTLRKILICLHPFMPFVTEEIWSVLPLKNKRLLMVEKW